MSYQADSVLRERFNVSEMPSFHFQRGAGNIRTKKSQKKRTLKFKHIMLLIFALAGIAYLGTRAYLYLITVQAMNITSVDIAGSRANVADEIRSMIDEKALGNIFLFNMTPLKKKLETNRWVKKVRMRKIFPSALKIEVQERIPAALLQKGGRIYLIDDDGVFLEELRARDENPLPVLVDANEFSAGYQDKIRLAWDCFRALPENMKMNIENVDLTEDGCLSLQFKNRTMRLILGRDRFLEKINTWLDCESWLDDEYGTPEYVDLRFFEDRIYFKPAPPPDPQPAGLPHSPKEVD